MTLPAIDRDRTRLLEFTEAAAFADMLRAAPAAWGAMESRTPLGWLLLMPSADLLLFNRLIGGGLTGDADRGALQECLQQVRALNLKSFGVQLTPAAAPEIREWLHAEGFATRDRWTKSYRGAGMSALIRKTPLRITRASTPDDAEIVASVTCASFGMPAVRAPWIASLVGRAGWSHYLAWDGDVPIAAAALFVTGHTAWLGIAGTLAAARRKGAQAALIAQRLAEGTDMGCRVFVSETDQETVTKPNPSFHNLVRAGFGIAYQRENMLPRP
jgi:hypothetical protein